MAKKLSDLLGMYFLDILDYIEYDLANKEEMINTCGLDYYLKQEEKIVSSSFTFENMVLNIRYNQMYAYLRNYKIPEHNILIYLQTDEKNISKRVLKDESSLNADTIGNILTFEKVDRIVIYEAVKYFSYGV